jgi:hypothetical protein
MNTLVRALCTVKLTASGRGWPHMRGAGHSRFAPRIGHYRSAERGRGKIRACAHGSGECIIRSDRGGQRPSLLMQTSRIEVVDGRWCKSEVFAGRLAALLAATVAALCCCAPGFSFRSYSCLVEQTHFRSISAFTPGRSRVLVLSFR